MSEAIALTPPAGWEIDTIKFDLQHNCFIQLRLTQEAMKGWASIPPDIRMATPVFVAGRGVTAEEALARAAEKATNTQPEPLEENTKARELIESLPANLHLIDEAIKLADASLAHAIVAGDQYRAGRVLIDCVKIYCRSLAK